MQQSAIMRKYKNSMKISTTENNNKKRTKKKEKEKRVSLCGKDCETGNIPVSATTIIA